MGTKCAPTYSSLFMGKFEEMNILPRSRNVLMIYVLYFVWKGTEKELLKFFAEINEVRPTIKFDYTFSKKTINFLDSKVPIIGNRLSMSV